MLEIKLSDRDQWHPHIHAIIDAEWMDKNEFSKEWCKASGGSIIVDVRDCPDGTHAAGYLAKYVTKGVDASVLNSPPRLMEAINALRGARAYDVFGSWRGDRTRRAKAQAEQDPDEGCCSDFIVNDWKTVASLREWLRALQAKEAWAVAIQQGIQVARYVRKDAG